MTTNQFTDAGFVLEGFLDCWMKDENGLSVTISDGVSCNGHAYEVQVTTDDGVFIAATEGDQTPESAVAFARAALAKVQQ